MSRRSTDIAGECGALLRKLDAFVDGELLPAQAAEVAAHAADCPKCQERVAFARALRHSLRACTRAPSKLSFSAPPSLRAKIAALLSEQTRERASQPLERAGWGALSRVPLHYAMAFAAAFGALSAAGISRMKSVSLDLADPRDPPSAQRSAATGASLEGLIDDLVALHKRPPAPEMTNPDDLRRFDLEVGVPVRRPALQPFDAQFKGARLYMSREGRAALLQYTVKGDRRVSLYVFDPRALPMTSSPSLNRRLVADRPVYIGKRGGYSIAATEQGGVGVALASDLDDEECSKLALAAINPQSVAAQASPP